MATIDKILNNHFLKSINELLEKFKATTIISKLELKNHHSEFLWLINYYNNIKFIVIHLKIVHNEKLKLILNSKTLHLEGFINANNTYYYFTNSTITQLPSDYCQNNENLGYSSHYEELIGEDSLIIDKKGILSAIEILSNIMHYNEQIVKESIVQILFITSEALKFTTVRYEVCEILDHLKISEWQNFAPLLTNWTDHSREYLSNLNSHPILKNLSILHHNEK